MSPGPPSIRSVPAHQWASGSTDNIGPVIKQNQQTNKQTNPKGPYLEISSQELKELGGLQSIKAELPDWPVSDDTVLHLATAEGLATGERRRPHRETRCTRWTSVTLGPGRAR